MAARRCLHGQTTPYSVHLAPSDNGRGLFEQLLLFAFDLSPVDLGRLLSPEASVGISVKLIVSIFHALIDSIVAVADCRLNPSQPLESRSAWPCFGLLSYACLSFFICNFVWT